MAKLGKTKKGGSTSAIDSNHDDDSGNENEKRVLLKPDKTKKGSKGNVDSDNDNDKRVMLKPDKTKKGGRNPGTCSSSSLYHSSDLPVMFELV